ncbi:MAG: T9SS type A sorting domain-containing protein [Chitinophagales bacterium]
MPVIQSRKANENIEVSESLKIKLYPNPCQSYTNIAYTLAKDSKVSIEVFNIRGEQVACISNNEYQMAGEHRADIDMSHLPNGTYICRVSQSNGKISSQRFVKIQ